VNKPGWRPVTFRLIGVSHYKHATLSCSSYGPKFGDGNDISIASEASSNKNPLSYLGNAYNQPSGHVHGSEFTTSFMAGSYTSPWARPLFGTKPKDKT